VDEAKDRNAPIHAVIAKYLGELAPEYGLKDQPHAAVSLGDVLCCMNERINILQLVLTEKYRTGPLPEGAAALRSQVVEAARAVWSARKSHRDAVEFLNKSGGVMGPLGAELAAETMEKHEALAAAERAQQDLQRRLFVEWGIQ